MKRMSPEAKVGLLVLAGVLVLVYMSFRVGKIGFGPQGGYRLHLRLPSAVGLVEKADVLVAGIPVGYVEEIHLQDGQADLVLYLREEVALPVDSRGSLRTHGVLGEKYVEIQPGRAERLLGEGETIVPGPPPADLEQLVTRATEIAADVQQVTRNLARVLGGAEGEKSLRETVDGFRDAAQGLSGMVAENRASVREAVDRLAALSERLLETVEANRANLDATLQNARALTETLARKAPAVTANLETLTADLGSVVRENRANLRESLANLREASGRLTATLTSVQDLTRSIAQGEGTLGRLVRDDTLYRDLQTASRQLSTVLGRLERGEGTLGRLLTDDTAYEELADSLDSLRSISGKIDRGEGTIGKLVNDEQVHDNLNATLEGIEGFVSGVNRFQFELGYRGELLAREGALKNYLGMEIRSRQDRFYSLGVNDDPVEDEGVEFSLQLGKRFSFLTVRAGLLESSGGLGLDADLWRDRLRLSFEAFDFDRAQGPPHLKLFGRYRFLKHLFVTAGVDDFIDDRGRFDYFLGAGLRFVDDDVRYLLAPAAAAVP